MSVESILSQAKELTCEQRAELFQRLEENLLDAGWQFDPEPKISDYVRNMLEERIREADADPEDFVAWETVRDESLAKIRK